MRLSNSTDFEEFYTVYPRPPGAQSDPGRPRYLRYLGFGQAACKAPESRLSVRSSWLHLTLISVSTRFTGLCTCNPLPLWQYVPSVVDSFDDRSGAFGWGHFCSVEMTTLNLVHHNNRVHQPALDSSEQTFFSQSRPPLGV